MAPTRAVANCRRVHSTRVGDQMPTRSPGSTPMARMPRATSSTRAASSDQVNRTSWWRLTRARPSGNRAAVAASASPMVWPVSARVDSHDAYDLMAARAYTARRGWSTEEGEHLAEEAEAVGRGGVVGPVSEPGAEDGRRVLQSCPVVVGRAGQAQRCSGHVVGGVGGA